MSIIDKSFYLPSIFAESVLKPLNVSANKAYIKNLEEELETNAHQKLHDWLEAEKMAKEIMEEYGVTK